jgi:hypothetical protein
MRNTRFNARDMAAASVELRRGISFKWRRYVPDTTTRETTNLSQLDQDCLPELSTGSRTRLLKFPEAVFRVGTGRKKVVEAWRGSSSPPSLFSNWISRA